eukprot:2738736-Pyramimonas_sp.AAC.1
MLSSSSTPYTAESWRTGWRWSGAPIEPPLRHHVLVARIAPIPMALHARGRVGIPEMSVGSPLSRLLCSAWGCPDR